MKKPFEGSNWTGKTNRTFYDAYGYNDPKAFETDKKNYGKFIIVVFVCVYAAIIITMLNS